MLRQATGLELGMARGRVTERVFTMLRIARREAFYRTM